MLIAYLKIKFTAIRRSIAQEGIRGILLLLVVLIGFGAFSYYLLHEISYGEWIYLLCGLYYLPAMNNRKRDDFLKFNMGIKNFRLLRLSENFLLILPFVCFLLIFTHYIIGACMLLLAAGLSLSNWTVKSRFSIPTPFQKHTFEFTSGFRRMLFVYTLCLISFGLGTGLNNPNFIFFSFLLVFVAFFSNYSMMEPPEYLRMYAYSPGRIMFSKIKDLLINAALVLLPLFAVAVYFFPDAFAMLAFSSATGLAVLMLLLCIKYAFYPHEFWAQLTQGIFTALGLCALLFPPAGILLLLMTFYFFRKSIKNLNFLLHADH